MRAIDEKVAERVMGWTRSSHAGHLFDKSNGGWVNMATGGWQPSTSAADDYEVLKHVREKWEHDNKTAFEDRLAELWSQRFYSQELRHAAAIGSGGFVPMPRWNTAATYEPGDYSRAALKALGEDIG